MKNALFAAVLLAGCQGKPALTVAAASSLQDALRECASAYEARTHERVELDFAGSNAIGAQIRAGAPVDVFVSADEEAVKAIESRPLLSNALVIVGDGDLRHAQRIAIGNPSAVPAGKYAKRYLEREGLWRELEPKLIPTENVRAALAAVDRGVVDAAFVYRTDALLAKRTNVATTIDGLEIVYPAYLLRERGRRFFEFLCGDEAGGIFKKYGFGVSPRA